MLTSCTIYLIIRMATDTRKEIQSLLTEAYYHYKEGGYVQVNQIYDSAFEKLKLSDQGDTHIYFNNLVLLKGLAQTQMEQYPKALESYNMVIEKEPLNVSALIKRGVLYMRMKEYEKSWADFRLALLLEPDNLGINAHVEELNEKLALMDEGESSKYHLKQQISDMVKLPEVQQDMLLNFSQLKLIDKHSVCSSKSVSIIKQPTATIEIEKEYGMDFFIAKLVKQVLLSPEEIKEIEKATEVQLEPKRLEEELNSEMRKFSPVQVFYNRGQTPEKSILRSSRIEGVLHPSNRPTSSFSQSALKYRRVSALQVKNIDGKVIKNQSSLKGQKGSDQGQSSPDIQFGGIQNIESLGKKQVPIYKTQNIKRKSSIKKGKSIITRPNEVTKFERHGHIDLFAINIDKPIHHHHESSSNECQKLHYKHSESSQNTKVVIDDQPQDIEAASEHRKSNVSRQENEIYSPYLGLGMTGLKRKQSILKSKRKFEEKEDQKEDVEMES